MSNRVWKISGSDMAVQRECGFGNDAIHISRHKFLAQGRNKTGCAFTYAICALSEHRSAPAAEKIAVDHMGARDALCGCSKPRCDIDVFNTDGQQHIRSKVSYFPPHNRKRSRIEIFKHVPRKLSPGWIVFPIVPMDVERAKRFYFESIPPLRALFAGNCEDANRVSQISQAHCNQFG